MWLNNSIDYVYLVVGCGAETATFGIPANQILLNKSF
jgi:NADH dehydrogenase FAD-containing subunit